jgi:hypothetical protein
MSPPPSPLSKQNTDITGNDSTEAKVANGDFRTSKSIELSCLGITAQRVHVDHSERSRRSSQPRLSPTKVTGFAEKGKVKEVAGVNTLLLELFC